MAEIVSSDQAALQYTSSFSPEHEKFKSTTSGHLFGKVVVTNSPMDDGQLE